MQKRLGLVSLLRLFSLLTDHKLVIFVTLLQLLACHLHCLKSKQDHLNLQLQYFSFHTSPVMLESQLCMLFCQCARSRRETSLLFWNYIGSAVLTAGKNIRQVNRYDSGQTEFLFQSHFCPCSHTSPRDTNPCDTVQEHCTSTNYKLAYSWCVCLPWLIVVGISSICTILFPPAESLNFSGVCLIEICLFTIIFSFFYLPNSVLVRSLVLDHNLYSDYTRSTYDQYGMCSFSCPKT